MYAIHKNLYKVQKLDGLPTKVSAWEFDKTMKFTLFSNQPKADFQHFQTQYQWTLSNKDQLLSLSSESIRVRLTLESILQGFLFPDLMKASSELFGRLSLFAYTHLSF